MQQRFVRLHVITYCVDNGVGNPTMHLSEFGVALSSQLLRSRPVANVCCGIVVVVVVA